MSAEFTHLHVHSDYSVKHSSIQIPALVERAVALGMDSLALTDDGSMYGAWAFRKLCMEAGIKPILGMEVYLAPARPADEASEARLVLLAQDEEGYQNLSKLSTKAFLDGGRTGRPVVDRQWLNQYSRKIIATSSGLRGEVAQLLRKERWEEARAAVLRYQEVFPERFYLEVQAHEAPGQRDLNERIFRLAEEMHVPVVATTDAHFLTPEDYPALETLLQAGVNEKRKSSDPEFVRYDRAQYLQSAEEVRAFFPDRPEVLENTRAIADSVDLQLSKVYHVPQYPVLGQVREDPQAQQAAESAYLERLARAGLKKRYADQPDRLEQAQERLEEELRVIQTLGYSGYHLIVWDFIRWARMQGIVVGPGRGSAAGSLVCYALGITDVCPLKYDLLFERYLNGERKTMPDIDVDLSSARREEVIEYLRGTYGAEAVSQISTFNCLQAKAVVRAVARSLGYSLQEQGKFADSIAKDMTLTEALRKSPVLQALSRDDRGQRLLSHSQQLEGVVANASKHPSGVVVAPGPVAEYVPLTVRKGNKKKGEPAHIVLSQYDMTSLEEAGLLKIDLLGSRALDVCEEARRLIRERHGVDLDFSSQAMIARHPSGKVERISLDDPRTYDLLVKGRTEGIFQMESHLATQMLQSMGADCFEDLVATNSLLRPGPLDQGIPEQYARRKRKEEPVTYPHEDLREILEPTHGLIVYQEQVMRIVQKVAGFSLSQADDFRKAIGKKDEKLIRKALDQFMEGARSRGRYEESMLQQLTELIESFGRYGFNRSHAVAYSLVTFQTAYLKAHYPIEFMTATLNGQEKVEEIAFYRAAAKKVGVPVLPSSVSQSEGKFSVGTDAAGQEVIRMGIYAIKNVGEEIAGAIATERNEGGGFRNFFDFVRRVRGRSVQMNKRVLEALILAGACDEFGERAQLMAVAPRVLSDAVRAVEKGERLPVDASPTLPQVAPLPEAERLRYEKELTGFYMTGHPMAAVADSAARIAPRAIGDVARLGDGGTHIVVGTLEDIEVKKSRAGHEYAKARVEDESGALPVFIPAGLWEEVSSLVERPQRKSNEKKYVSGVVLAIRGRLPDLDAGMIEDADDDPVRELRAERVLPLSEALALAEQQQARKHVRRARHASQGSATPRPTELDPGEGSDFFPEDAELYITIQASGEERRRILDRLAGVITDAQNQGIAPVWVAFSRNRPPKRGAHTVQLSAHLVSSLQEIVGIDSVEVRRPKPGPSGGGGKRPRRDP